MKYKKSQKQLLDTYPNKIEKLRSEHVKWDRHKYLKSEQHKITNALKLLRQKKLVKRSIDGAISQNDLKQVRELLKLPFKDLKKIAQLQNITSTNVKKQDLIYMLLRSNANVKESIYLDHLNSNLTNVTEKKVNEIRKQLIEIGKTLSN